MSNAELTARFVEWITIEKGLAEKTVGAYCRDLKQFAHFLGNRALAEAQKSDVSSFQGKLLSDGIEGRSVARKVSSLRQFFRFLPMDRVISTDPTAFIRSPKAWKVLPKSLERSEIEMVLNPAREYAPKHFGKYLTRRDQALLELLYAGALRVSEMIGARLSDLNLNDRVLIVRGKGDKERIVPFGIPCSRTLEHWLAMRPLLTEKRVSPWLFVGRWGRQLTRMRVWQIINERSQGMRHASPHMLRHSCATRMLENGADLRTVQTLLGHADIGTTELYTHVAQPQLRKIYLAHHPRAHTRSHQGQLNLLKVEPVLTSGPIICAHCMSPVCKESKWYCETHLRLQREAAARPYQLKKTFQARGKLAEGCCRWVSQMRAYRTAHPHARP